MLRNLGLLVLLCLFLMACAPAAPAPPPGPGPTASPVPIPTPVFPQPPPPAQGQDQVRGVVQSISESRLVLVEGREVALTVDTRFLKMTAKVRSDLQQGSYVGITAVRQADGDLLASHVGIFPPTATVPPGQRPDWGDALMSNATIEAIEGDLMTVNWGAGQGRVRLRADVQVFQREAGSRDQLRAGAPVTVVIAAHGAAASVSFY